MKILGIDYGRSKIGLAIADGLLAEPWKVIREGDKNLLINNIKKIAEAERIEKIVVGVSEGEMGEESKAFASAISHLSSAISVETFDETLTSHDAQSLSRQAGIGRKKRREMEDAYAAAIILQNYIDNNR